MSSVRLRSRLLGFAIVLGMVALAEGGTAFAVEKVSVAASVGVSNQPPFVASVTPNTSPVLVSHNAYVSFSLKLTDPDSANVLYTVSTSSGAVLPASGNAPISGGQGSVNFTYFAPSYKAKLVPVFVTLNDQSGNAPIVKEIDVYVF